MDLENKELGRIKGALPRIVLGMQESPRELRLVSTPWDSASPCDLLTQVFLRQGAFPSTA